MQSQFKLALALVLLTGTAVSLICAQDSSPILAIRDLSFPSKLAQGLQQREFRSDNQLVTAKKDVDANIERLQGQELVSYLNKLGIEANASFTEEKSASRLALFKWAYALRIAVDYSGKLDDYALERGERFSGLDMMMPAAAKLFGLEDGKSREESEIIFLYLGRFFPEQEGVVALGVNLLKQDRTNIVLKQAIFYAIANMGSINYDPWNETFLYLAKSIVAQLGASSKIVDRYDVASIHDTMFYQFEREEDRLNALKGYEYVAQKATTPYWKQQALFNIKLLKNHKGK